MYGSRSSGGTWWVWSFDAFDELTNGGLGYHIGVHVCGVSARSFGYADDLKLLTQCMVTAPTVSHI